MIEAAIAEAARTNTSGAGIAAICAVSVACLAFWLAAVMLASREKPGGGGRQLVPPPHAVTGGMHVAEGGRSVAPNRYRGVVPGQRTAPGAAGDPDAPVPAGTASGPERAG
jgi:hypothetical protein